MPNGGGSLRGIDETFQTNAVNGTAILSIPLPASPGRSGFGPALGLSYDSGAGNGAFGIGWRLTTPYIGRRTDKALPRYRDADHSDAFLLSGGEDLVPALGPSGPFVETRTVQGTSYEVRRYMARVGTDFSRIELWRDLADGQTHWRVTTPGNITSIYGRDPTARIADPDDPARVFTWMLELSNDDKGNCIQYLYRTEDLAGVESSPSERHRLQGRASFANTYLKRVRYGNKTPFHPAGQLVDDFQFELVFDYGEHDLNAPGPDDAEEWVTRPDPFSSYRAGFEIRTYRLCRRVLMFHRFEELGAEPQLVSSLRLTYATHPPGLSFLMEAELAGHIPDPGGGYTTKTLPALSIDYQLLEWDLALRTIDRESVSNLPSGVDGLAYDWVDLEEAGLPGILSETEDAWYFKPNLGDGRFGPLQRVAPKPSFQGLQQNRLQLMDIEADGRRHAVAFGSVPQGSFAAGGPDGWEPFRAFDTTAIFEDASATARLIDLTGDGRADLIVDEDDAICWYRSRGASGFDPPERVRRRLGDDATPQLVFAGSSESIFLADMSGDGLADVVRIRNGDVAYWPNLGYGRFGVKVVMDGPPRLDHPDSFDPRRIQLADVDGSGMADLIYLSRDGLRLWTNASGNGWAQAPVEIDRLAKLHPDADIQIVDLLGTGTASVVWSSSLPSDQARPMQYVDLAGSRKPHLMTGYRNNAGKEVRLSYTPSTRFYLDDAASGTPWVSQLPFPVQCVATVDCIDHVTDTRLRSRYRYHHGHYDRTEREFRGFGAVDRLDTETFEDFLAVGGANTVEEDLYQPPVLTKSWFDTGQWLGRERLLDRFRDEYYTNPALPEPPLAGPALSTGLTAEEQRQAIRACKATLLRREVYALDGSADEIHPYVVTESSYTVDMIQPQDGFSNAAFLVVPRETLSYHYERKPVDPRVVHTLVLDHDEVGNVTRAASAVYGRPTANPSLPALVQATQNRLLVTVTETDFTHDVDTDVPVSAYRLRLPHASRVYELTGLVPADRFFTPDELRTAFAGAPDIAFEATPGSGVERRLLGEQRIRYRRDDLSGALPFGTIESLGLPFESYLLAFTPTLLDDLYGDRVDDTMLNDAGYVHMDGRWWIPSGRWVFATDAPEHFYLPSAARDPFGMETTVAYDGHDLLVESITDALGNTVAADNDYRTLTPVLTVDPNQNRTAVRLDELGLVTAVAVMGKANAGEGDTLADPTVHFEYDLTQWSSKQKPNFVRIISREHHGTANTRFHERYIYSDGFGNVVMTKVQAEPGLARSFDPVTETVIEVDTTPAVRWVGNGRRVVNNKGNPVRQYEPYFSVTHEYEDAVELVETGATITTFYDPLDRVVRTELPNGTFMRTNFDPWRQISYDPNDTVLDSTWYVERGTPDPAVDPEPADPEERAAWLAAGHADTPLVVHVDALGRGIYSLADGGFAGVRSSRAELDTAGSRFRMFDTRSREVANGRSNLAGVACRAGSAERGERWTLLNVVGNAVWAADQHGRTFRTEYDELHRPTAAFVSDNGDDALVAFTVWGEQHPTAVDRNLRGRLHRTFDQAGTVATASYDFKGNQTVSERTFALEYRDTVDWTPLLAAVDLAGVETAAAPLLGAETFTTDTALDALNRVVTATLPDGTTLRPAYNEANIVNSLQAQIGGTGPFQPIVLDQDYDAKGQLLATELANGTVVERSYDPTTFRLIRLVTRRTTDGAVLQNLSYTYDPVGNPTECADAAQQTLFFANAVVEPVWRYGYNPLYELVSASGREHAVVPTPSSHQLPAVLQIPHPNDTAAVRRYTETYEYDDLGNIRRLHHAAGVGTWDRRYRYAFDDNPADRTNRLSAMSLPGDDPSGPFSATYDHDLLGNMTRMPHLALLDWDFNDRLRRVDLGGGGTAYYVYGASGQRLRKTIERTPSVTEEHLYLGAFELERTVRNNAVVLSRETVHLGAHGKVAEVVTKTVDTADPTGLGQPAIRYQYNNMLGSAVLETDENGNLISYEEYHPYGTTAFRSGRSMAEASLKRYRFLAEERDDETGLYLFGLRYYAPWLARWTSADPAGLVDGANLYRYAGNNPIGASDRNGTQNETLGTVTYQTVPNRPETVAQFEAWIAQHHPERRYEPGSVRMTWETNARGQRVPVFWARWLTPSGDPLLPEAGQPGSVAPMADQPPATYSGGRRTSENEHGIPGSHLRLLTQDPESGGSDYTDERYRQDATYRNERNAALDKTHGNRGGPGADNPRLRQLRAQVQAGQGLNYRDDIFEPARQNAIRSAQATGSRVTAEAINRAFLEQDGNLFSTHRGSVIDRLPQQSRWQQFTGGARNTYNRVAYNVQGYNRFARAGAVARGVAAGLGTAAAYQTVPFLAETAIAVEAAGHTALAYGLGGTPVIGQVATAAVAAPAGVAATALGGGVAGYFVGDAVEGWVTEATGSRAAGVASGTASGALAGAAVGAVIGSVIPGVGTAVGAIVGGVAGAIGGFIGSFW